MKKHILLSCVILPILLHAQQQDLSALTEMSNAINKVRSANSKDILSNFFQANLQNIFGDDKALTLNATLYAIDSFLNPAYRTNRASEYAKQKMKRRTQLAGSVTINGNNEISLISGGIAIALINNKDITYADFSSEMDKLVVQDNEAKSYINSLILEELGIAKSRARSEGNTRAADSLDHVLQDVASSWGPARAAHDVTLLHPLVQQYISRLPDKYNHYQFNAVQQKYEELVDLYSRRGLLTAYANSGYDRISDQAEWKLGLEYTVGLNKEKTSKLPTELEAALRLHIARDTGVLASNTDMQTFSFDLGVNKIISQDKNGLSTMEAKAFFSYHSFLINVPPGLNKETLLLNATLRIKLLQSLWLPLTLRYDPENANLLGILNITANLGDLTGS